MELLLIILGILQIMLFFKVWGIVYLFSGYAKYLSQDKRKQPHTFFL